MLINYTKIYYSIAFLTLLTAKALASEAVEIGKVSLNNSVRYSLHSKEINQTFHVDVIIPQSYKSGNTSYPVLYVTDGIPLLQLVSSGALLLELGGLRESIVVGISYKGTLMDQLMLRGRDLTPSNDPELDAFAQQVGSLPKGGKTGGAGSFLSFILNDVKPLINKNFRTLEKYETLLGHSNGGLFGLYVLFSKPDSFENYIITNPDTEWDDGVIFSMEEKFSENNSDLNKNVFLAAGAQESHTVIHTRKLYDKLRNRNFPNLNVYYQVFEHESHFSVVSAALNRGIRYIYSQE